MNLDFGILWIEDSFSEEEEANLRRRVLEAGFVARIETLPNSKGVEEVAHNNALYHQYDIVLLDYRLQGENGDELAPKIRELFPSTTILFYSGSRQEDDLRRLIADRKVEGVYCCARTRFIERAGSLIDQTAKSLDRLSGMRGLAMRVVAECDAVMKTAVLSMATRNKGCADKVGDLDEDVVKSLEEIKVAYEKLMLGDLAARLSSRAVDSAKLFKHFRRLTHVVAGSPQSFGLASEKVERLRELRNESAQYVERVLKKRNLLGHVVEVKGQKGWELSGDGEITIDDFPELRRVFAAHVGTIRELASIVTELDTQEAK